MTDKKQKETDEEVLERLNNQIDKEIAEKAKGDSTFLPSEYRKWRLSGLKPSEIDYDMDHIWR